MRSHKLTPASLAPQRGKGLFYFGVGLLVFFMAPKGESTLTGHWGVNNVAAMVLAIVGGLHFCQVVSEGPSSRVGPTAAGGVPAVSDGTLEGDFNRPLEMGPGSAKGSGAPKTTWNKMVDEDQSL